MRLSRVVATELIKVRGLPAVVATVFATIGVAIALAAGIAATSSSSASRSDPVEMTLATVPFLQIGIILIAILVVASEHAGSQIRTTLTAIPQRTLLLAGKAIAYLVTAVLTAAVSLCAGFATAAITLAARDASPAGDVNAWPVVGAGLYLVLIGLLALALAVLLRSLVPPLVTMLALVLIASPLLAGSTEHARWLPDRAGSLLYQPDADAVLTTAGGVLVQFAWIAATSIIAAAAFTSRDA
ncbi:ABC transporter permease [Ornithinimicrobium pratense]|uniref:ABC transporter permease n=1 Tax=Ornithinimicrobium pratense TaxID=2593973 RepID=A0A5J6V5L8_9MICO|nr:ABC transporter permease [Ornithinimicrobium pratense]QFG69270.1 ABC transporter permease [Ornithinimicrobium pratense]